MLSTDAYWHLMKAAVSLAAAVEKASALGPDGDAVIAEIIDAGEHLDAMGDADAIRDALAA
jgi:hypothetical protein